MSDETNNENVKQGRFKVVDTNEQPSTEQVKSEEQTSEQSEESKIDDPIQHMRFFRNLKLYLNKMIGKEWLLLYRSDDGGNPIFVPNEHLNIEDQVFLAELAKRVAFDMVSMRGMDDY